MGLLLENLVERLYQQNLGVEIDSIGFITKTPGKEIERE